MRRTLTRLSPWIILLFLWAGLPLRAATAESTVALPGEVLVGLKAFEDPRAVMAQLEACVGTVIGYMPATGACRLRLRADLPIAEALNRLRALAGVRTAEPNHLIRALAMPNDPLYSSGQYAPKRIQADQAWQIWQPQAPVVIAIVDSGIDSNHPDLANKIYRDETGTIGFNTFTNEEGDAFDDFGHGTHCAGIAAAQVNNGIGVAGIAGWNGKAGESDDAYVKLMPVKVLNHVGYGDDWRLAQGITWAADHGARVISLSLAMDGSVQAVQAAVGYAVRKGCVVVAAAGNEASSGVVYPAAYDGVISVAATDDKDTLANFSNYGSWVRTAAPGVAIRSAMPTPPDASPAERASSRYYRLATGTSMACPHVAGEAALLLAQNPSLSVSQVGSLITSFVDSYTPYQGRTLAPGAGRINVYMALKASSRMPGGGPPALARVSLAAASLTSGSSLSGTVVLTSPAPLEPIVIRLASSDRSLAVVPDDVTVSAGAIAESFTVTTQPVTTPTPLVITASYGDVSRTASLMLLPDPTIPSAVTLTPLRVTGGNSAQGRVTLGGAAPRGGTVVTLRADDASIATVPERVTVPTGARSAFFLVRTRGVRDTTAVSITATRAATSVSAPLTLLPPVLTGLTLKPSLVRSGSSTLGQVTLSGPAPDGGAVIALASGNPDVATVPASITVPAGATSATFPVGTQPSGTSASLPLTASFGSVTRTVTLRTLRNFSVP